MKDFEIKSEIVYFSQGLEYNELQAYNETNSFLLSTLFWSEFW